LVPHYTDLGGESDYHIISPRLCVEEFINDICRCEKIYSSSLHGIVCANAYGIPVERIKLGNKTIGGDFKFNDYQSVKPDIEELWELLLKFLKMGSFQEVK
jgi:pyruvyltransferase